MNKIIKILFVSCIVCALFTYKQLYAQQNHFIYIQADDQQTFSVNINGKTYNSSEIGYVIIPKLNDGKYQLNISFPNNKFPDQQFNCVINKADVGYALKNFGDKGWGLFNLQSLEITMTGNEEVISEVQKDTVKTEPAKDTVKTNAFGDMLSEVVNDSTLKVATVDTSVNKENKQESLPVQNVTPSVGDSINNEQTQIQTSDTTTALNKSIIKIGEETTDEGVQLVFVDPASGNDTVKILLPSQQEVQEKVQDSAIAKNTITDSGATADTQSIAEVNNKDKNPTADTSSQTQVNNPFFSEKQATDTANKSITNNPVPNKQEEVTSSQIAYKQDCKKMFSDNDLDKLKKKMVAVSSGDKMIQTARKYFENKCVTSEQVKSLGALFLSDDARYGFFDAAYPYVYDISSFTSLESQLIDPYYKKRFRAMLK